MSEATSTSLRGGDVSVGDELPLFELPLTSTLIVAGAIASRDFMPAHHDAEYARGQGAPDVFMNILTTNGYIARFITDQQLHAFKQKHQSHSQLEDDPYQKQSALFGNSVAG